MRWLQDQARAFVGWLYAVKRWMYRGGRPGSPACSRCIQRDPDRPLVRGEHLIADLDDPVRVAPRVCRLLGGSALPEPRHDDDQHTRPHPSGTAYPGHAARPRGEGMTSSPWAAPRPGHRFLMSDAPNHKPLKGNRTRVFAVHDAAPTAPAPGPPAAPRSGYARALMPTTPYPR